MSYSQDHMPRGVNYPLYIPLSCQDVAELIESFQSVAAVELLWKKVQDRNHEAAALLAYIHLRGAAPKADFPAAYKECRVAAEAGEPYAEWVISQIKLAAGKYPESIKWLQRACDNLFPPALAQMGRLMTIGTGFPHPDRASALRMYRKALRFRHVPTLALVAKNLLGSRNPLVWSAGALLVPIAIVVGSISIQLAPFKLINFLHVPGDQPPLFSVPKARRAQ